MRQSLPSSSSCPAGYTMDMLRRDVVSGCVVGIIALALGMALGIASEATPATG